jgi:hypothetical protein
VPSTTALNPGTYTATVTVSGTNATSVDVTVVYTVTGQTGTLRVPWSGLPSGISPSITVFNNSTGQQYSNCGTTSNPCVFNNVPVGTYRIQAYSKTVSGTTYTPNPAQQILGVTAGGTTITQTVVYGP